MKIGIIGAGHIGGTLTRRLRELGHEVAVSNSRAPETLADLANETGATAVWAKDAAAGADLVVVSIPQKNVPDPSGSPNRIALPIAGDDGPGRALVHDIVDQLGFEPVDAGPISESWRQQPGTPLYGKDFDADNTRKALSEATPRRTPEFTARTDALVPGADDDGKLAVRAGLRKQRLEHGDAA